MFDYQEYLKEFKAKANNKTLTSWDMAELAIHKALKAKNNDKLGVALNLLYGSFTPIRNVNRLENGAVPFQSLKLTLFSINAMIVYSKLGENWGKEYLDSFKDLLKQIRDTDFEDTVYAYIFVKQDMSREQQMVQCGHVSMVLGQAVSEHKYDAKNLHFIVFGVANEMALWNKIALLDSKSIKYVTFVEPDMNNAVTAIACLPMKKSYAIRKRLFDEDKLLVME